MLKYIFLLGILLPDTARFAQIFGKDYEKALAFYHAHQSALITQAAFHGQSPELLAAIVFPEWIRYSYFSDFFETESLRLLYVEYGSRAANFSVGQCQMKPSFAEQVEAYVAQSASLKAEFPDLILSQTDVKAARMERLSRLENFSSQLMYLSAFVAIMHEKFPAYSTQNNKEQVAFYATAYNAGFDKTEDYLIKQQQIANFPYGSRNFAGEQYRYAEVAVEFWELSR